MVCLRREASAAAVAVAAAEDYILPFITLSERPPHIQRERILGERERECTRGGNDSTTN